MKWGWDHRWARKVKGKVSFPCLKTHSGILSVKGEQVKCNSDYFPVVVTGRFQVLHDFQEIPPCWFLTKRAALL